MRKRLNHSGIGFRSLFTACLLATLHLAIREDLEWPGKAAWPTFRRI